MPIASVSFSGKRQQPSASEKSDIGKAIASVFVPGLGQFADKRNKDGLKFSTGCAGISLIITMMIASLKENFVDLMTNRRLTKNPKTAIAKLILLGATSITGVALWFSNVSDAYKGKK